MDLKEAVLNRRSVRKYSSRPVEKEVIYQIIEAGTWAPTACNHQDYQFIIINEEKLFSEMMEYGAASFLKNVKTAVLVLYNNQSDNVEYLDYIQSAAASIQNMLLKAHELNVGTCWVCNLPSQKQMRKMFGIPKTFDVIALISMGYYDQAPRTVKRKKSLDEVISLNQFAFAKETGFSEDLKLSIRRWLRKIYFRLPKRSFLRKIAQKYEKKFEN